MTLLTEMLTLVCWSSEASDKTREQRSTSSGVRPENSESDHYTLLNLIIISCYSNQECFCDDADFFKYHSGDIKLANCLYIQSVCVARTVIDSVP